MNSDIRLALGFFTHPKTIKLQRRLGLDGVFSLQRLWCFAAMYRCSGELFDMDAEEIAIASGWLNEPLTFVTTLVELRWLDVDNDGVYRIHNWVERNGYASDSDNRSDKSRFSRMARLYPEIYKRLYDTGVRSITALEYKESVCNARSNGVNESLNDSLTERSSPIPIPIPIPSPNPKPKPTPESVYFTLAEFRNRYRESFGVELGGGVNESISETCKTYTREAINDAFVVASTKIPRPANPFTYIRGVLMGKSLTRVPDKSFAAADSAHVISPARAAALRATIEQADSGGAR